MSYPSDYMVKHIKEREIKERIARAEVDRLALATRTRRAGWAKRSLQALLHSAGHLLLGVGAELDKLGAEADRAKQAPVRTGVVRFGEW